MNQFAYSDLKAKFIGIEHRNAFHKNIFQALCIFWVPTQRFVQLIICRGNSNLSLSQIRDHMTFVMLF